MRDAVKVIRYDGQARLSMVTRIRLAGHKSLVVRHWLQPLRRAGDAEPDADQYAATFKAKWIGMLIHPTPETPDDTPTENIWFPTRIRNALAEIGLKTVGEIRESSDVGLRSIPNLGHGSVAYLRQVLGTQRELIDGQH